MLLIGNGRLVTRAPGDGVLENGGVVTDGGLVLETGTLSALRAKYPGAEFIDARGGVIMPGLINVHHHIYSAFGRGLAVRGYAPASFMDILEGLWWRLDRCLTLEDCRLSAMTTYIDCIKNGVTTVFDHHASYGAVSGSLFELAEVSRELGLRSCLCYEVSDRCGEAKAREAVRENAELIAFAKNEPMLRGVMGLHASCTLSDKTLALCAEAAGDAGFHIHVAEGEADQRDCLEKYGERVVARLHRLGLLGRRTLAVHCVHVDGGELELLRASDSVVVHNPESNMGNAVGCPPTMEIFRRGILTGLGTDGYTSDMLESYKAANTLHKHALSDPGAAWTEVPAMLFEGNARIAARFFDNAPGTLRPGAPGDVIVLDYDPPTPMDSGSVNSHILFGMNGRSVVTTVCAGRVLMRDRRLLVADEAEVMAKCRENAAALAKRING